MRDESLVAAAGGEVVLLCRNLEPCAEFFAGVGFRLDSIFPADNPRVARLSGYGLAIRLEHGQVDGGGHLRIPADRGREITAPNGTRLEFAAPRAGPTWQPATFFVRQQTNEDPWREGRAGMLYRDLVTGRQEGWLIASRIRVPRGGAIADYVHYHRLAAQVIYCRTGWVRVVYQDQGEPFVMRPGDCVLQPPGIRHRVLECSDELEVLEVSSPAEHETCVERELELPTANIDREREFGGQRFVRHEASGARLGEWSVPGFEVRDTPIAAASRGAIGLRVVRPTQPFATGTLTHQNDRRFWFVLAGNMTLHRGAAKHALGKNGACVLPPREPFGIADCSPDLEFVEIAHNRGQCEPRC